MWLGGRERGGGGSVKNKIKEANRGRPCISTDLMAVNHNEN